MKLTFPSVLFLIFLTLKLTNVIDWSWWWVTCPLWSVFALIMAAAMVIGIIEGVKEIKCR